MNQLIKLNNSTYQYYKSSLPIFLNICRPVCDLGVKWFAYIRIFKDGSYLCHSTHEEFFRQYLLTIENQGITPTLQLESAPIGQSHVMYPSCLSLYDKKKDSLIHLAYNFDIWHIYAIYKNRGESIEAYTFGMNIADEYAAQFYFKNMPLLEHFCLYFSERATTLINADDKKKRGYFQQQFNFNQLSLEDQWLQRAEQFLLQTQLQRLPFKNKEHEILLSKRETECVRYLALGKSAKEIAKDLSLSPRTIETYLKNIKNKTGYTKETQIVAAFSNPFKER